MRPKSKVIPPDGPRSNGKIRAFRRVPTPQYLFVYGTLKRGGKSHKRLREENSVRFRSPARIQAELYSVRGGEYPGAVLTSAPSRFVKGDLFVLQNPQETLRHLDEFEGVDDGLFRRELVDVWARRRRVKAWVYLYARPLTNATLIPAGIYSSH
ncbi:MAG: gamma-glutamylcyclotransferase family protein [Candidatus Acidiferrum sp.]